MIASAANGGGGRGTDCEGRVSCACSNSYYTLPQGGRFKTITLGLDKIDVCMFDGYKVATY